MAKSKPQAGDQIPGLIESLLAELGEDPERQGLRATPERVSKALRELTDGYGVEPEDVISDAVFGCRCPLTLRSKFHSRRRVFMFSSYHCLTAAS